MTGLKPVTWVHAPDEPEPAPLSAPHDRVAGFDHRRRVKQTPVRDIQAEQRVCLSEIRKLGQRGKAGVCFYRYWKIVQ